MKGRRDELELAEEGEKDLVAVHQMRQKLRARVALHLAVGQYVIGQV